MKKLAKRTIVLINIVALLGITILSLGLIRVKQDNYFFKDYNRLQVFNLSSANPHPGVEDQVAAQLSSVRFSVLGAILERQFNYRPTIIMDAEGEEPNYLTATNIKSMSATSERYMLHFIYDDVKSIKVSGVEYFYDCAFVFIQEGFGEIVDVRVVPYEADRVYDDSDGPESTEFYKIPDLRVKMRTSKLFVTIANAIDQVA